MLYDAKFGGGKFWQIIKIHQNILVQLLATKILYHMVYCACTELFDGLTEN